MEAIYYLKILLYSVLIFGAGCLCYLIIELIRSVIHVRRMIERMEMITDIRSWFGLVRTFSRRRRGRRE